MPTNVFVRELFDNDVQNPVDPEMKSLIIGPLHQIRKSVSLGQYDFTDSATASVYGFPGLNTGATPNVYWFEDVVSSIDNINIRLPHLTEAGKDNLNFILENPTEFKDYREELTTPYTGEFEMFHAKPVRGSMYLTVAWSATGTASAGYSVYSGTVTGVGPFLSVLVYKGTTELVSGTDYTVTNVTGGSGAITPLGDYASAGSAAGSALTYVIEAIVPNTHYTMNYATYTLDVTGPAAAVSGAGMNDWHLYANYDFYPVVEPVITRYDKSDGQTTSLSPRHYTVKTSSAGYDMIHLATGEGTYIDDYSITAGAPTANGLSCTYNTPNTNFTTVLATGATAASGTPSTMYWTTEPNNYYTKILTEDRLTGSWLTVETAAVTSSYPIYRINTDGSIVLSGCSTGALAAASAATTSAGITRMFAKFGDYTHDVYVTFSALRVDKKETIYSIGEMNTLESSLQYGSADPDWYIEPANPLAYAMGRALVNAGGNNILCIAVETNDTAGYISALDVAAFDRTVYEIFPLSMNQDICDAVQSHVEFNSIDENTGDDKKRACMFCRVQENADVLESVTTNEQVHITTSAPLIITDQSGPRALLLTDTTTNFVNDGIKIGDKVKILNGGYEGIYTVSNFYVTGGVSNQILVAGAEDITISYQTQFSDAGFILYHEYADKAAYSTAIGLAGERYRTKQFNYRTKLMWPYIWEEFPTDDGRSLTLPGYFACACYAGLFSNIQPHQGLSRYAVLGTGKPLYSVDYFSYAQLNNIEDHAWWIMTRQGSQIYCREQFTQAGGAGGAALESQRSIVAVADTISKRLHDALYVFTGIYNIVPQNIPVFRQAANAVLQRAKEQSYDRIGSLIIDGKVTSMTIDVNTPRTILVGVKIVAPEPVDTFSVTLRVSRYTGTV